MGLMDFYICSSAIREFVLSLCRLSNQVFEISLNSSLVTDELSSLENHLKSYAVYSEAMSAIANSLGESAKGMLWHSTRVMEVSLEKTKFNARVLKLKEGLRLVNESGNISVIGGAIRELEKHFQPLDTEAHDTLGLLDNELKKFKHEIKKLWFLSNNLKAQVEFDDIGHLTNVNQKIEITLVSLDEAIMNLSAQLLKLEGVV